MCFIPGIDPFTLSAVTSAVGTAVSAAGAIAQGQQQSALAKAQAQAQEQQAEAERRAAAYESAKEFRQQQLLQSSARAQVGASGVGFAGSPTAALVANAGEGQMELEAIQFGSTIRQNNLRTQADISRMQGKAARTNSMFGAASTIIGGASNIYSDYRRSVRLNQNVFA